MKIHILNELRDHRIRTVGEKLVGFGRGDGVGTDDDSDSINA